MHLNIQERPDCLFFGRSLIDFMTLLLTTDLFCCRGIAVHLMVVPSRCFRSIREEVNIKLRSFSRMILKRLDYLFYISWYGCRWRWAERLKYGFKINSSKTFRILKPTKIWFVKNKQVVEIKLEEGKCCTQNMA